MSLCWGVNMKIIRCSMYAKPYYTNPLISHTWLTDNEDGQNLIELLRYDGFGFSDATAGRRWGRQIAYSDSYEKRIIYDNTLIIETLEKINQVKKDLTQGNRNINISKGLF